MEESFNCPNKKYAGSSSTKQSSISTNEDSTSLERGLKFKDKMFSNTLDEFHNICTFDQFEISYPHRFINLLYQLELSVLCLIRKNTFENSSEPVIFRNSVTGKFNNIVLRFEGEDFCVKVQHVDTYYSQRSLNFNSFFSIKTGNFTLRYYLNEFAIEALDFSNCELNAPKCLIIYTNSALDITKDKKLKRTETETCDQLQLICLNSETDKNLLQFFQNNGQFYRFASDENTRNQLTHLVTFTKNTSSKIKAKGLSEEEIRKTFFDRLILAVNQPSIEELVDTVRTEVRNKNENFCQLRKEVMNQLLSEEETVNVKSENLQSMVYSFDLFMFCLHEMFLNENIVAIKFAERINSHSIAINFRDVNFPYFRALEVDVNKLSLKEFTKQREIFSIDSHFSFFIQELDQDLDYFVIYTNVSLTILRELILGNKLKPTKEVETIYRPQFSQINATDEKYDILRHSFINADNLYHFAAGDPRKKILNLLTIPSCFPSKKLKGKFAGLDENQVKEMFLNKIVFAVNQHNSAEMYKVFEKKVDNDSQVPYDCKNLHEIALRYLKSHEFGPVTKKMMLSICDRIKNNKRIFKNIVSACFQGEINFAKRVLTLPDTLEFSQFMDFLIKGEGKVCLDILRRNKIQISNLSSIIEGSRRKEVYNAFCDIFNVWFDKEGNKTQILKTFEKWGFCVDNISFMLSGSGSRGATTLINLYNLWFDDFGNATKYLTTLKEEKINASNLPVLLSKSGAKCVDNFKALYALWFDENGSKTQCLKNLEGSGVSLTTLYGVLFKSGGYFQNLYNLWFDENGQKTTRWKKLEEIGVTLGQVCNVLRRTEKDAADAFEKLYNLWFDAEGGKTFYLQTMEREGVRLPIVFDILAKTGLQVSTVFENLHNHWFHTNGDKTHDLKTLEARGLRLPEICRLLSGAECSAVEKFKKLVYSVSQYQPEVKSEIAEESRAIIFESQETKRMANTKEAPIRNKQLNPRGAKNPVRRLKREKDSDFETSSDDSSSDEELSTDDDEENRRANIAISQDKEDFTRKELERKITFLFHLFPSWQKGMRSKDKMKRIIKEVIHIINNDQSLKNFLENKVQKHIISKGEMEDVYSLISHCPFTTTELEDYLQVEIKLSKNSFHKHSVRFAKTIFVNEYSSDFKQLFNFVIKGDGKRYLQVFRRNQISLQQVAKMFHGSRSAMEVIQAFRELYVLWFDESDCPRNCLINLRRVNINLSNLIITLYESGIHAAQAFTKLYNLWFDATGNKTRLVETLEANGLSIRKVRVIFKESGVRAAEEFQAFYDFCFDAEGNKTERLNNLETEDIKLSTLIKIFKNSRYKVGQVLQELYNLWFDDSGNKTERLQNLEIHGINLKYVAKVLLGEGKQAPKAFENLYNFVFDEKGNKQYYLMTLERDMDVRTILDIIINGKTQEIKSFKNLYDLWYDSEGNKTNHLRILEENGVNLKCLSSVLKGTGPYASNIFKKLIDYLFDKSGNKTKQMKNIENVVGLRAMFEMISGARMKTYETFMNLCNLWFTPQGNKTTQLLMLEKREITLMDVSRMLNGSGKAAARKFKKLCQFVVKNNLQKYELLEQFEKNEIHFARAKSVAF